jgi:5'-phosphate synthase pdxT subunit
VKVGLLALQGAVGLHAEVFGALGVATIEVRTAPDLADIDALVIPGGESTTISRLLATNELFEPVAERLSDGMPTLGTCAGMIMLAADVLDGRPDQRSFGAIDIAVRRNAFGRQVDSFEAPITVRDLPGGAFPGVFIRAPFVERIGPAVSVIAEVDGHPVACRQGNVLVTAFHPELAADPRSGIPDRRVHELFCGLVG